MKINPWHAVLNVLVGLGILYFIHKWILPHSFSGESPTGIFDMEKLVMTLVASSYLFGEVNRFFREGKVGLTLRDIGMLFVALTASGLIYVGLVALSRKL